MTDSLNDMRSFNLATISGVQESTDIPAKNARDLEISEGGVGTVVWNCGAAAYCGPLCIMVDVWVVKPEILGFPVGS